MDSITFANELLLKIGVSSNLVGETNFQKIDKGIRALLFDNDNYTTFLNHTLREIDDNKIYRYMDEFHCCYIVLKISKIKKYFFIGPYLLDFPTGDFIKSKMTSFEKSDDIITIAKKYYMSLPIIEDENFLISIATVLGKSLWGNEKNFTFEYMDDVFFDQIDPTNIPETYNNMLNSSFYLNLLETNYSNEKKMLEAVSSGNLNQLDFLSSSLFNNGLQNRLSDSLRNRKNYLIILNTLLRKAAEQGGVHLLHIDKLSSQFTIKIEEIHTIQESINLQRKMMKEYCFLVKSHSLSPYSTLISKVITLIDYDISADLSLKSISKKLYINPSYLSNAFSRELGQTLTEYVHSQRLTKAVMMIHKTDMQIQDIASSVGITDINYFIRLFKKHYGLTPSAYRKEIGKQKSGQKA